MLIVTEALSLPLSSHRLAKLIRGIHQTITNPLNQVRCWAHHHLYAIRNEDGLGKVRHINRRGTKGKKGE